MNDKFPFICPVCAEKKASHQPLTHNGNILRCQQGHSFDISAKGYVNLLLSQHKNVKDPGDSKAMVAARRSFLDSGAYSDLRDCFCGCVKKYSEGIKEPVLVDCGCGEGYYTVGMYDSVPEIKIFGIDISKNALAAAHSRINANGIKRNIFCAAASVFRLPFENNCADMAAVIFAPFQREELLRIVKPGGIIFTAIPDERHLFGLKSLIYESPRLNTVKPYDIPGMKLTEVCKINNTLEITNQEMLNALFTMTPYYYKTSQHDSNKVYSYFGTSDVFSTEISFQLLCYRVL